MTGDVIVSMADVRAAKLCMKGSRAWCKAHNIDWRDFAANGIPASVLIATGDPMVARVVDVASARNQHIVDNSPNR